MSNQTTINPVTEFALDIVQGRKTACKWVKLACERHLRDLKDARWVFDEDEVNKRIKLFPLLKHYKGSFKGKPFILSDWQKFVIGSIFGWKWKDSAKRRYRYAFIKVPRKNGKTFLAAGVAIQMLLYGRNLQKNGKLQPEGGAEVYFVATKEDQAKIGWKDCCSIIKRSLGFSEKLTVRIHEIRYDDQDAFCKSLGSDSETLDGLNPVCAIKDEFHAWPDRNLHDVIEDAYGARDQPLDFIITTEGTLRNSIHDEIDTHCKNILSSDGSYLDDSFFAMIYEPDEGDDPFDEKTWEKSNPNLGISKSMDYMRDQASKARLMPNKYSTFLTKQLNRRTDISERWLSMDQWDACKRVVEEENLVGIAGTAGLDLARSRDMSSFQAIFPDGNGGFSIVSRYWIPEAEIEERKRRDRVPYDVWERQGFLTVTEGNVTDFRLIENEVAELCHKFQINELAYDPMFATDLALRLRDDHGLNVTEFSQTFKNFAMPCKELERLLISGQLHHNGNPILRWNAGNVVSRVGPSGNQMPDKAKSSARIDGIVALLMALGRQLNTETGLMPMIQ